MYISKIVVICFYSPFLTELHFQDKTCLNFNENVNEGRAKEQIENAFQNIREILKNKKIPGLETWPQKDEISQICDYYKNVAKAKRTVLWNIFKAFEAQNHDVMLVTQTNLARLDMLNRILVNWKGHVSVAVHVTPNQVQEIFTALMNVSITNFLRLHIVLDPIQTVG